MSTASKRHRCPICLKCYTRQDHLQRHTNTHSPTRLYRCISCNRAFQRSDVLKRHLKSCDGKATGLLATPTKRRACDRCVHQKKACSFGQPCENCQSRSLACSYSFTTNHALPEHKTTLHDDQMGSEQIYGNEASMFSHDSSSTLLNSDNRPFEHCDTEALGGLPDFDISDYLSTDWLNFINLTTESQPPQEPHASHTDSHIYSFPFLDSFTSRTGLLSCFDCGNLIQRQEVLAAVVQSLSEGNPAGSQPEQASRTGNSIHDAQLDTLRPLQYPWTYDTLSWKACEITLLIKEVIAVKPQNSAITMTWSLDLEEQCSIFFSPTNIRKFLELYWAIWHPNVNFMHRPTFNPVGCKSILLASMALIGASVSPDPMDNEDAKNWFDCVEHIVFSDCDFCSDTLGTNTDPFYPLFNRPKIEALQAAYMVVLYQNWEGSEASKCRMRRLRYGDIISVTRDIGIASAKHMNYKQQSMHEFNWNEFVAREELIRTFLWIFLLDHAFTIFNNLPPRMVIKEMKMHLAFPESCFQAVTKDECYDKIQLWMLGPSPTPYMTLYTAVKDSCEKALAPSTHRNMAYLGPLNLFAIVSAFHSLIFQYQNSFGGEAQEVPIRNGLRNWIRIWGIYTHELFSTPPHVLVNGYVNPQDMWKRVGFLRYSMEYWSLANLILDRISTSGINEHDSGVALDAGLSRGEALHNESPSPILDKYDQTSMLQVNSLISTFQEARI